MNAMKTAFLLGLLTALLILVGGVLGGRAGLIIAFGLAVVMNGASYWASDRIVLAMHHAQPLEPSDDPELHDIVAHLAGRAGMPKPRIYLIPSDALNAFATGRDPEHAVVAVTRGIRGALDREEMEGVLAHELSHVKNRDILISSVAATVAGAVMMLAGMARWAALFGGYGGRDERRGGGLVGLLATAILAPFAAMLIQMAISRSREFEADRSGALLAGQPQGLARALQKLDRASQVRPLKCHPATSHLFIMNPLRGGFTRLFSTHPPTRERLVRLVGQAQI